MTLDDTGTTEDLDSVTLQIIARLTVSEGSDCAFQANRDGIARDHAEVGDSSESLMNQIRLNLKNKKDSKDWCNG